MRISDWSSDVCSSDLARHTLAAAIYTNRQGRFTDRSIENQEYRASGLNLLIAAISYWNTVYMDRAAQHLQSSGGTFDDRSEEHTSELKSLMRTSYAVFCLKKKKKHTTETQHIMI